MLRPFLIEFHVILPTTRLASSAHQIQPAFDYSKADYEGMCSYLLEYDFSIFYGSTDVETIWSPLKSTITSAIALFTPDYVVHRSHHPKWFTKKICYQLNCLHKYRRKCKVKALQLVFKISQIKSLSYSKLMLPRRLVLSLTLFVTCPI